MKRGKYDEFWSHVDIRSEDECWEWIGDRNDQGYGRTSVDGRYAGAHRRAYELAVGPISDGKQILHSCDNRACCNPRHLRPGTNRENIVDRCVRKRSCVGEHHPHAKLTGRKVATMRAVYAAGLFKQRELAEIYGITPQQVSNIIRREWWASV